MKAFYNEIIKKYIKKPVPNNSLPNNSLRNITKTKLNIVYITQDIYDKDNLVSLSQLLRDSSGTPKLEITGKAYFSKEGYEGSYEVSPPLQKTKFNSGLNMFGWKNNFKGTWKYNSSLTGYINRFIVDCWKKCSRRLATGLPIPTVVFMDQKSANVPNPNATNNISRPKPIGFHENMFVNAAGYWAEALGAKAISKKNIFTKSRVLVINKSKQYNKVNNV